MNYFQKTLSFTDYLHMVYKSTFITIQNLLTMCQTVPWISIFPRYFFLVTCTNGQMDGQIDRQKAKHINPLRMSTAVWCI